MIKLLISLFITLPAYGIQSDFVSMRAELTGCYTGLDNKSEPVTATINYIPVDRANFNNFFIKGKKIAYLDLRFLQERSHTALATQLFESGSFLDSRILNNQITYKFYGTVERILNSKTVGKFNNGTLFSFKKQGEIFTFEVYQNDNTEFLTDFYFGYNKTNFKTFIMNKVDC